jgi:aldehyde dehydrogenase (NAD+)
MNFKNNINYRKKTLEKLFDCIVFHEKEIIECLYKDFRKPPFESFLTETDLIISELKYTIENIHQWSKPKRVRSSIRNFPSSDYIYNEPYGNVLIISPWNYPFLLAMSPLIAAIAAGNSVTLKPSELTPNTSGIISKIIRETFNVNHAVAILGDVMIAQELLKKRWDYIFFTGSVAVGKIIAKAAAENLTPVTLELGGKNPCIVAATANLKLAAKRIVWGKILNAGQTCVAPDYLLVDIKIKTALVKFLKQEITKALGDNPELSPDYARIINHKNWERQIAMIENQNILFGGQSNRTNLYLAPTLLDAPSLNSLVMKEEIFGPILPIISYESKSEIEKIITSFEKPLSFYIFSEDNKFIKETISKYSFGGGCINDTIVHLSNHRLPFGGVGHSGIGAYHGKLSFDIFSHKKAIHKKATWLDISIRYAPYKNKLNNIRKLFKWI